MGLTLQILLVLPVLPFIFARKWNNTGKGTIAFEEAWTLPDLINFTDHKSPPPGTTAEQFEANLFDIHNQRLSQMDATGVDFMVLSCATPCIQAIPDPATAEEMARTVNNALAASISNNTFRFGAFGTMAMHNPAVAAAELERTVKEFGFLGALLNDYQQTPNGTVLFYDQPEYDVFWEKVVELDVPVYLHPRSAVPELVALQFQQAIWLNGPSQGYAVTLSNHILGICTNGVFDRFPKVKLIVGHLGERIPSDLARIDEQLLKEIPNGLPMKRNITSYWQTNLFETTSGNFATPLLKFHLETIGLNRIMYSIDYPYINIQEGQTWIDELLPQAGILSQADLLKLKRETAIEVLGLNK
ncbi:hypothetical protein M422DRAFT_273394 [Sphaerobolus stellatus SS14]|uniref:Amidohydrolase-related domain-containing protein n=1 Tax=Sphaerobolus stellatus (strain SS14) TaxID=990650 RepID=A0A0C9U997_SPHS4|nr:hypothetical protein M422DRAFT_273394 [Sphaerobolus stellatus SS14]